MPRPATLLLSLLAGCGAATPAPELPGRTYNVGFLVVDGVYNTELMAPFDIFHHSVFHAEPGMRVFTVAPTRDVVTTFEGLRLLPDFHFESAPPIDVLVVPSAEHSMDTDLEDEAMLAWVSQTGQRAQYVISLCDGAFVLAAAGLLEGREATTFPSDVERLRADFPGLVVHEDVSFVRDGPLITSAGGALSYDAALYLAEVLYGREAARGMAGGLCIDWRLGDVRHLIVEGADR